MEFSLVVQSHHPVVYSQPRLLHSECFLGPLYRKLQGCNSKRCMMSSASTPRRFQLSALQAAFLRSSLPLQQYGLKSRIAEVRCRARATEGGTRGGGGQSKSAEGIGSSTMGEKGEEPYRVLPGGRKVYLKELDVLAFLEEETFLRPLDPLSYNSAAYLWKKLDDIPEERRTGLLDLLEPRHLTKIWKIAGRRYSDLEGFPQSTKAFAMMPTMEAEGPFVFEGLVNGVPWPLGWLKRFSKAFFVSRDGKVYGRVIGGGKLLEDRVKSLFPLYFRVKRVKAAVPTEEPCELAFDYTGGQLQLAEAGVPEGFPLPAKQPYPFSDAFYDYLRPAGPGILIGQSWHEGADPNQTPQQFLGEFILIRRKSLRKR